MLNKLGRQNHITTTNNRLLQKLLEFQYKTMDRYKINITTWNKLAFAYQEKFMHLDLYNDTYAIFCERIIKPNARILEIGCGPGNITRYILAKRPDFHIKAIDTAPNMIKLAQENNPQAHFAVLDGRAINKLPGKFDGIMCGFCLPYLSETDCKKLIKDSAGLLNSGGICYFSFIEGDYHNSGFETGSNGQMYVYYYQADFLQSELQQNNIEQVELIRKTYQKSDGTSATHLIFIAEKQ